jgi:hypothetical protein
LNGLPKDAHIIDKWHDDNICDGNNHFTWTVDYRTTEILGY